MTLLKNFRKNTIISIESEDQPGVVRRFLIEDVLPDRKLKLVFQNEYKVSTPLQQLLDYMDENSITQACLSDMLRVSRTTVNRWINGHYEVPRSVLASLGIKSAKTDIQIEQHTISILESLTNLREQINKTITTLQED